MINKNYLDKLYSIKQSLEGKINELNAVKVFEDNGYSDRVHDARVKELKSHLSTVDAIIEAYLLIPE